jgi:nicotinamide riboside kinase
MTHWDDLLPPVRPYYLKRVCVCDSALAHALATRFRTVRVHAYDGGVLGDAHPPRDQDELLRMFRGQLAAEDALARQANRVLLCETDALTMASWSDVRFGSCPPAIVAAAEQRRFDLYLFAEDDGRWERLAAGKRPFVRLGGPREAQLQRASEAIQRLIASPAGAPITSV